MTKQSNKTAYPNKKPISDNDYLGGTNGDTIKKETKSFQVSDLRDYLLSGLAPEVGGTLKITEIVYEGVLTTPEAVANQLNPTKIVLQYEIVIFNINGDKYQLKLQDVTIGLLQTPVLSTDFIPISLVAENLSESISTYKGYNSATGREEHYSIGSVGFSITKELDEFNVETGVILLEQTEQTKLGSGTLVYKGYNSTTKKQEFYSISSPDHNIALVANEIVISNPSISDVPNFIVNSDYVGDVETGTQTKPFKNLQNALDAYKGVGTNLVPEFVNDGVIIDIQKDENVFVGNLAYNNLNLILRKGVILVTTPTYGQHFLDVDSDAILPPSMSVFSNTTPCNFTITLEEGAVISSTKKGIKTRGTNLNTNSGIAKVINILGEGNITISNDPSVASASVRNIIDINSDNQVGFFNDGSLAHINLECNLYSNNTQIYKIGLNGKLNILNNSLSFGNGIDDFNVLTKPFENNGGVVDADNVKFPTIKKGATLTSVVHTLSNTASFYAKNCELSRECEYLFENVGSTQPFLSLYNCTAIPDINTSIAKSTSVLWQNNDINGCYINGLINDLEFKISASSLNTINGEVLESLNQYPSKADAVIAGLFSGCAFVKAIEYNAVDLVADVEYKVTTFGDGGLGALGSYFTATGSEIGTAKATLYTREILI